MLHRPQYDNIFNLATSCKFYKCIALVAHDFYTIHQLSTWRILIWVQTACDVMVGRLLTLFNTCANTLKWGIQTVCRDYVSNVFRWSISVLFFHPSLVSAGCGCSRPPNGGFQNGRRTREGSPTLVERCCRPWGYRWGDIPHLRL